MIGKVGAWLDDRTGLSGPLRAFLRYPVPQYVHKNLLYSLGGLTLIVFTLQLLSGLLLLFTYDPSPTEAYNSVDYLTYQAPLGWLVRGVHHYGASAMVILVGLHMLHAYFTSAYKPPRELNWLTGVGLLLITLGFGFTGYLLPWDQKGYWATKVGIEVAGSAPGIGKFVALFMRGGEHLGQATLSRFYAIHVFLLPLALGGLILIHLQQLRRHGMAPPVTQRSQALARKFVPFYPHWVITDGLLGVLVLLLLVGLSWWQRAPLEFAADPTSSNYTPRPEWYFLFLFQLLKYFPGPLEPVATILLPLLFIGGLIVLPFVDTGAERRPWRKPVTTGIAIFCLLVFIVLTMLAR